MKGNSVKKIPGPSSIPPKPLGSVLNKTGISNKAQQKKPLAKQQPAKMPTKTITSSSSITKNSSTSTKSIAKNSVQTKKPIKLSSSIKSIKQIQKVQQKKIITRFPNINNRQKKQQLKVNNTWGYISFDSFLMICHFYARNLYDVYSLSLVCKAWRFYLHSEDGKYCWLHLKDCEALSSFQQVKQSLLQSLIKTRQVMSIQYQKLFIKLFNYGSTKENIPNKLIEKLNLQITVDINKKKKLDKIPFKLKTFNFSSYLCFKLQDVKEFKYDFYTPHNMFKDKLHIAVRFFSRKFKVAHQLKYELLPEDIVECSIRQKAFNYYLEKNLILTFFQGDDHFLYFFFEMSALELVNIFRSSIQQSQKEFVQSALKKLPLHKKLAQTQFQSFVEYMKFQADFQLHMSYHNSIKQIFTFCDTKVYPLKYDNKQAYFMLRVDDTFPKIDTYKLDNKMGMSEGVQNLYLLDLTLKDRDKFLITFSGFIYARKAELKERETVQNYFNFAQNQMKILQFKNKKYELKILIIEELKKNFIYNIQLIFYA